ncbi:hypothetical protein [Pleionea mediterranea]|uniref:Uncharacterized protein n=1 Tax=Pleionea mediterranea TaxID=523701 RepID=A0A316FPM1_9GAMM|nr:hypothetical protein [Pleionea mediterranea]PWK50082.1 hypothetical protein C8D97_107249 [Pleionea mediterranea]
MASKAKPLNDEIKKSFYPFVFEKGFERLKTSDPHFAEFRRTNGERVEFFDIQWDKYWRPYFVLNFKLEGTEITFNKNMGRLQRKKGGPMSCWFSLHKPLLKRILTFSWYYSPEEVVLELTSAFSELEEWWETGVEGPHIYIV